MPSLQALRQDYQTQGYCVLPNRLDSHILESVSQEITQWIENYPLESQHAVFEIRPQYQTHEEELFKSAEGIYGFLEQSSLNEKGQLIVPKQEAFNKIGHALHDLMPTIKALAMHELIAQCIDIVGWQQALLMQSMVIFKSAHIGAEVPWHQDASYLITSPQRVCGIWIALEDATKENGCLWMAQGQHTSPLRERYQVDWTVRKGHKKPLNSTPWPGMDEGVAIEVPAGSIVLFHDHIPHRSSTNYSDQSRKALTFHCCDAQTQWDECNWLHRTHLAPFPLYAPSTL